jgi:hypoxia up-regulated 1
MLFQYVKMLAEIQAGGHVRDCVITIPSWFTYDQRLMIKDAAEQLANLNVLQLVHENTAAAVMFGIDQKIEHEKNLTVLFYNMGAMDTEVQITRYSMFNISEKKSSPYIHILSEAWDRELGSQDLDVIIVNILAEKFNAMPERAGKTDVRENYRAVRRLFKDAVKIKEILSANKFASVKIPELLDYVTLKFNLERTEVEAAGEAYFARVKTPITSALEQAGLTMDDIDQVEILGGGVRTPKTLEHMELALGRKDLSTHLNGDEAMCFGSAFIASNSSSAYKVKHVFLTQNPKYDVHVKITALNEEDALSEDEQKLLGAEEDEIIKYTQEFRLFNTTDYIGKSKGLSLNYDKDMKIELFSAVDDGEKTLIDTFIIDNIAK